MTSVDHPIGVNNLKKRDLALCIVFNFGNGPILFKKRKQWQEAQLCVGVNNLGRLTLSDQFGMQKKYVKFYH